MYALTYGDVEFVLRVAPAPETMQEVAAPLVFPDAEDATCLAEALGCHVRYLDPPLAQVLFARYGAWLRWGGGFRYVPPQDPGEAEVLRALSLEGLPERARRLLEGETN